jgi:hypothetical protein
MTASYPPGAIKRNTDTLAVALRTSIIDAEGRLSWLVATLGNGAHYATDADVASWPDVILHSTWLKQLPGGVRVAAGTGSGESA